jgi:aryl-alcohol dehydrogenase-like predicted oxidoreductase/NAD-dependent dihydropyrimidine dehydrogenase PreA subunit
MMQYTMLGKTGIRVSRFAFGTLTMAPMQRDLPVEEGARLLREALQRGVTFLDTAQIYGSYPHIRQALEGYRGEVVIASKSAAKSYRKMEEAVREACRELGRETIDIFLMHAVQREEDLAQRREGAWRCLQDLKKEGVIRAAGLSTHNLNVFIEAAGWPEIDVMHPIFNMINFGLLNAEGRDVPGIIKQAYEKGLGLYAMKPLAGGHLHKNVESALRFAFDFPYMHAVTVGMVKQEELDVNLKIYYGQPVTEAELLAASSNKRMFVVIFCEGCGLCLETCEQGAIALREGKAVIDHQRCVLCGYCRQACTKNYIRII